MSKVLVVADNEKVTAELVAAAGDSVVVESSSAKAIAEYAKGNSFDAVFVAATMDGERSRSRRCTRSTRSTSGGRESTTSASTRRWRTS